MTSKHATAVKAARQAKAASPWLSDPGGQLVASLEAAAMSPRTVATYTSLWRRFSRWLEEKGLALPQVTPTVLQRFFTEAALSRRSCLTGYGPMLNRVFDALVDEGVVRENPMRAWAAKRGRPRGAAPTRLPPDLTANDYPRLEAVVRETTPGFRATRTRAVLATLLYTGVRVSECAGLRLADLVLDADRPQLSVVGKGNRERVVPLSPGAEAALAAWLAVRTEAGVPGGRVFSTHAGAPLTRAGLYRLVARTLTEQGIVASQMGPHLLRHAFATRQLRAGVPLAVVKSWLGHADAYTTLKVYEHVVAGADGVKPVE